MKKGVVGLCLGVHMVLEFDIYVCTRGAFGNIEGR